MYLRSLKFIVVGCYLIANSFSLVNGSISHHKHHHTHHHDDQTDNTKFSKHATAPDPPFPEGWVSYEALNSFIDYVAIASAGEILAMTPFGKNYIQLFAFQNYEWKATDRLMLDDGDDPTFFGSKIVMTDKNILTISNNKRVTMYEYTENRKWKRCLIDIPSQVSDFDQYTSVDIDLDMNQNLIASSGNLVYRYHYVNGIENITDCQVESVTHLLPPTTLLKTFGDRVAISGTLSLVQATGMDAGMKNGVVYVYENDQNIYQVDRIPFGFENAVVFGTSLDVADDGTFLIGTKGAPSGGAMIKCSASQDNNWIRTVATFPHENPTDSTSISCEKIVLPQPTSEYSTFGETVAISKLFGQNLLYFIGSCIRDASNTIALAIFNIDGMGTQPLIVDSPIIKSTIQPSFTIGSFELYVTQYHSLTNEQRQRRILHDENKTWYIKEGEGDSSKIREGGGLVTITFLNQTLSHPRSANRKQYYGRGVDQDHSAILFWGTMIAFTLCIIYLIYEYRNDPHFQIKNVKLRESLVYDPTHALDSTFPVIPYE